MNLPGPTRKVPKHIEDELLLGAELDKAKARIKELEKALGRAIEMAKEKEGEMEMRNEIEALIKRVEALEAFRKSMDNLALLAASFAQAKIKLEVENARFSSAIIAHGEIVKRYREREE